MSEGYDTMSASKFASNFMKFRCVTLAFASTVASLLAIAPAHATIIYSINQTSTTPIQAGELTPLSNTVLGTITTNGTLGLLKTSDILSYNIQLIDNIRPVFNFTLTPQNSAIWYFTDLGLTATATALSFDFTDAGAGFLIQGNVDHGLGSGYNYFCYQATTGACAQGETIVPNYFGVDGVSVKGLSGKLPLDGGAASGAVPEPATWAMMLLGFGAIGFGMRSQQRQRVHRNFA